MVPGMMLVLYLVSPGSLASVSFYRLSLSLSIYRNSVGTVFLIVSFPNDNTETFGTISTTNVHILRFFDSIPTIFLSTFLAVCIASAQSTLSTYKRESIRSPMLSGI